MLRLGKQIRMTAEEQQRLVLLIGGAVGDIKTAQDLNAILDEKITHYEGYTAQDKLMRHLPTRYKIADLDGSASNPHE
jgi:hypothetical protein